MSQHVVMSMDDVQTSDVRIKKPVRLSYGDRQMFPLAYGRHASAQLFVQSPVMMLVQVNATPLPAREDGPSSSDRIQLRLHGNSQSARDFASQLDSMEDQIMARIGRVYPDVIGTLGRTRVRNANAGNDKHGGIAVKFQGTRGALRAFDASQHCVDIDNVAAPCRVTVIFSPHHVWVTASHYGVELRAVQMLCADAALQSGAFAGLPAAPPPRMPPPPPPPRMMSMARRCAQQDQLPDKYAKMVKMGVPIEAVRIKMKLDNVDCASSKSPHAALIAEINSGGVKLRNSTTSCNHNRGRRSVPQEDAVPAPPSLSDILAARKLLKKVVVQPDPAREREKARMRGGNFAFLQDIAAGAFQLRPVVLSLEHHASS